MSRVAYRFFLVGILSVTMLSSGMIIFLSPVPNQPFSSSAFATFPGENGKIAFASYRDGGSTEIYTMNVDGSEQTRLTSNPAGDFYIDWSPDGTKIVFMSTRSGSEDIYVMNSDGSDVRRLTTHPASDRYPSWSPDGTKIAFMSTREGSFYYIYVMNSDGSDVRRLTTYTAAQDVDPDWSPDGTKIAFISYRNGFHSLYVVNVDGSSETPLIRTSFGGISYPEWSPDGTKIAFSSTMDSNTINGVNEEIYVINADGSEFRRLTNSRGEDSYPSWSPDGSKIVFGSYRDGNGEIYVMNSDGSDVRRLTTYAAAHDVAPDWGSAPFTEPPTEEDTIPPILTVPEDMIVDATTANGGTVVTYTVTAEDNADGTAILEQDGTTITQDDDGGDVTISCEPASGSEFPIGQTMVECTAIDAAGNEGTASFMVLVDPPPPAAKPALTITELDCSNYPQALYIEWRADGLPTTPTPLQGYVTSVKVGDTENFSLPGYSDTLWFGYVESWLRTLALEPDPWTFTFYQDDNRDGQPDQGGLQMSTTFTCPEPEPEDDMIPPVLTVPEDITEEATSPNGATVSFAAPHATDDVDGPVEVTCDYSSGDTFPIGGTVVTCSAEDAAGNSAEETFTITVQDTTDPDVEITQVVDRRNRVVSESDTTPTPYIRITFEATDAVGVEDIECSLDGQTFTFCTSPVVYDRLSRGTHQVTVRATDEAGNTGEDQFTWTVNNPSAAAPGRQ